jgi:hypothetical protein
MAGGDGGLLALRLAGGEIIVEPLAGDELHDDAAE